MRIFGIALGAVCTVAAEYAAVTTDALTGLSGKKELLGYDEDGLKALNSALMLSDSETNWKKAATDNGFIFGDKSNTGQMVVRFDSKKDDKFDAMTLALMEVKLVKIDDKDYPSYIQVKSAEFLGPLEKDEWVFTKKIGSGSVKLAYDVDGKFTAQIKNKGEDKWCDPEDGIVVKFETGKETGVKIPNLYAATPPKPEDAGTITVSEEWESEFVGSDKTPGEYFEGLTKHLMGTAQQVLLWVFFGIMVVIALIVIATQHPSCHYDKLDPYSEDAPPELKKKKDQMKAFRKLQLVYLLGWYMSGFGDWLQGANFYALPVEKYNFTSAEFQIMAVVGFLSSAIFGTVVGGLGDSLGRKLACQIYCVLYIIGCLLMHFNNIWILLGSRLVGGVCTSLLFSTFEAWYVGQHFGRKYSGELLGASLGWMFFGHSLVAILSGVLNWLLEAYISPHITYLYKNAEKWFLEATPQENWQEPSMKRFGIAYGGKTAPFDLAAALLLTGLVIITVWWTREEKKTKKVEEEIELIEKKTSSNEANEEEEDEEKEKDSCIDVVKKCFQYLKDDKKVVLVGVAVTMFESSMYVWVLLWYEAMIECNQYLDMAGGSKRIDAGILFSLIMMGFLAGSGCFSFCMKRDIKLTTMAWATLLLACISCVLSGVCLLVLKLGYHQVDCYWETQGVAKIGSHEDQNGAVLAWQSLLLTSLIGFEFACGMYFPTMGSLKARIVPEDVRTTMYNLYYCPTFLILTAVVCIFSFLEAPNDVKHIVKYFIFGVNLFLGCCALLCVAASDKEDEDEKNNEDEDSSSSDESDVDEKKKNVVKNATDNAGEETDVTDAAEAAEDAQRSESSEEGRTVATPEADETTPLVPAGSD